MVIVEENLNKNDKLWIKAMDIGASFGCHQRNERSFSFKGYQFPLCARCTGIVIGYILTPLYLFIPVKYRIITAILSCILLAIDGLIQYFNIKQSNNIRRVITGILCGAGISYMYCFLIYKVIIYCIK